MIDKVKGVVDEFKPIVDFITSPIPGLDKAGISISILDLAKSPLFSAVSGGPPINTAFLDAIVEVTSISRTLDLLANAEIDLGSLTLDRNALAGINPRSSSFDSILLNAYKSSNGSIDGIKAAILD